MVGSAESPETAVSEVEVTRVLIPSPLGSLGLELTGDALTRVVIVPKGRERRAYKPFQSLPRSDALDEVLGRFSEYFAGARRDLGIPYDARPSGLDAFGRRVLRQTARIPYGRTRTFQDIASAAGRPDGYRQVLSVLMSNPLPIVVPCHRVVTAKVGEGSYIGGPKKKAWLLKLESKGVSVS